MICGYVNGVRSGECSAAAMAPANRQMGTGEPLEVGGEDSYTSHPLWDLASVLYYDRTLSSAARDFMRRVHNHMRAGHIP